MAKAYRQVTKEELFRWSQELVKADQQNNRRDFARTLFGETAYKVEISIEYEYNDEGGYDPRIDGISVYDVDGEELVPDFRSEEVKAVLVTKWDVTYKVQKGATPEEALEQVIQGMEDELEESSYSVRELAGEFNVEPVEGTFYIYADPGVPLLFVPIDTPED